MGTFDFYPCLLLTWGTFNICTIWGHWIDRNFLMTHMPSTKSTASKHPQESPECTTSATPLLERYPYLLEGLPYALEVVTNIKKPRVSL